MVDTAKIYTADELAQALKTAAETGEPVLIESDGQAYAVRATPTPPREGIWENYDVEAVLAALEGLRGTMKDVDAEEWIREIQESRGPRLCDLP